MGGSKQRIAYYGFIYFLPVQIAVNKSFSCR